MNPYYCYVISFALGLAAYALQWSIYYPRLTWTLFSFLLITMIIQAVLGRLWQNKAAGWKNIVLTSDKNPLKVTAFIYVLWAADFIYEGGVPLVKIALGLPYNYRLFGVPSLHVFTVTFASFYTVYLFHLYLSTKHKLALILCIVNLLAAILIYSRAMLIFNLSSCAMLYLFSLKVRPIRLYPIAAGGIIILFYFFGVFGNLRIARESKVLYDSGIFLNVGAATDQFRNSGIPAEYFWGYFYISSPVANLQQNIKWRKQPDVTVRKLAEMLSNELLFDFISKRTNRLFHFENLEYYSQIYTIGPAFNTTTLYSRSFTYLGWIGMIIMALFVFILPWCYLKILPSNSPFFLTGLAILCTLFLFMAYDNTIRFTGLGFQLVYPVLLAWLYKKRLLQIDSLFLSDFSFRLIVLSSFILDLIRISSR